jgi:glycosyltransferase involved in cell wall biosynthesis
LLFGEPGKHGGAMDGQAGVAGCDVTILMPCLNEARTLATCIKKAQAWLLRSGRVGEVVVADNGSTDGSREIAAGLGARVVPVTERGYGSALRGGIDAARGRYIIMGDSDDSYDFSALDPFVARLDQGFDFVIGNRFRGGIEAGAMPPLHRYFGNPVLSFIGRLLFGRVCNDFNCGLRGFRRDAALRLRLQSPGMEFASEMIIKALIHRFRLTEVPTTLAPDGRGRPPHLRSWRDGWRQLRFYLLLSPRALFLYPGAVLFMLGVLLSARLFWGDLHLGAVTLSFHTLIFTSASTVIGWQMMFFWVFAKLVAMHSGLLREDGMFDWFRSRLPMEVGAASGATLLLGGLSVACYALLFWYRTGFGPLDELGLVRTVAMSSGAMMLGASVLFSSFFLYLLDMVHQRR